MEIELIAKDQVGSQPPVQIEKRMYEILQRAYQSNNLTEFQDFIYGLEKANIFSLIHIQNRLNAEMRLHYDSYQHDISKGFDGKDVIRKYFTALHARNGRLRVLNLEDYEGFGVIAERVYECLEVLIIWFEESFNLKEYLTDNQRNELIRMLFFRHKKLSLEEIGLVLRSAKLGEYGQVRYQLDISHFSEYMKVIRQERAKFIASHPFSIRLIDPMARKRNVQETKVFQDMITKHSIK